MKNSVDPAAVAFDAYAAEMRRLQRLRGDPHASSRHLAAQRTLADQAFKVFWDAFTGDRRSPRVGLRLVSRDGGRVDVG